MSSERDDYMRRQDADHDLVAQRTHSPIHQHCSGGGVPDYEREERLARLLKQTYQDGYRAGRKDEYQIWLAKFLKPAHFVEPK
jgi:hypothetical protein